MKISSLEAIISILQAAGVRNPQSARGGDGGGGGGGRPPLVDKHVSARLPFTIQLVEVLFILQK